MKLYSFTPYHPKGLGHAYNQAASIVPDPSDWILLQDADLMLLPGNWGDQVADAVERSPGFDAYVCKATRTWRKGDQGDQQLLHPAGIREERDLLRLFEVVEDLARRHWAEVIPWPGRRAPSGFWMLFRKRLWLETPFPLIGPQGVPRLGIDTAWFRLLMAQGKRIGLLVGLAAIHFYRMDRPAGDAGYLLQ